MLDSLQTVVGLALIWGVGGALVLSEILNHSR